MSSNPYLDYHIERIVKSTKNLYKQKDSICNKCHNSKDIYCLFCYCPLYYKENCGGDYVILPNGVKDCNGCIRPHTKEFCIEQLKKFYEEYK